MTTRLSPRRVHGFGLLEALVALVLFSLVGMAAFGWINTSLDAAVRVDRHERALRDRQLAGAWIETLNPMARASGEIALDDGLTLRWQAHPITPATPVAPLPGGQSTVHVAALYEVEAELLRDGDQEPVRWQHVRLGHRTSADAARTTP